MAALYILSEGERDDLFYDLIAERVTGRSFERPTDFRVRHGSNWKAALAAGRLLLNRFRHWKDTQEVAVILAIDNDRAPGHPGALPYSRPLVGFDTKKGPRYSEIVRMLTDAFGADRGAWPVEVAVAVPVEMIESWVLLLSSPQRNALPIFAEANQPIARPYHGQNPPPQLKDLCKAEAEGLGLSLDEYFWRAAEQDLEAALPASKSLQMFVEELRTWRAES